MCGIAGSTRADPALLAAMAATLRHRGPDGSGTWRDETVGFGLAHTRLAVIDLSAAAAQPMTSADGRFVLAYNGEIYNFPELRGDLAAEGVAFRSASDTEVLLALLARDGVAALDRLAGMFAFALWDRERRELMLARDRLGEKPLLYAPLAAGGLAFASEIAALKVHPGLDFDIDREALSAYLACLYVPAPMTIHRGIRKLPPGHVLRWRAGTVEVRPYWRARMAGARPVALDEAAEDVLPALRRAVEGCMIADVPVGCFLSGGLDSSVIAALMAAHARTTGGPPIRTFTMAFSESAYDERLAAREVAHHIGSTHIELAAEANLGGRLDAVARSFGEPFGNPTALLVDELARATREHVTVALAGDGGDEVFAGYPRYRGGILAQRYRRLPGWLRRGVLRPLAGFIPESAAGRHGLRRAREFLSSADLPNAEMYAAWVEYFTPAERGALLGEAAPARRPIAEAYAEAGSADPLDAMQETDLRTFLPGNLLAYGDAMTMRRSLELRLPMLDHRLVEIVGRMAGLVRMEGGGKAILRRIAQRLLPRAVVGRPKVGFNPPMGVWLKRELAPLVRERLTADAMAAAGIAWGPVRRLLAEHGRGRDHALKIWALLALDAWRRAP